MKQKILSVLLSVSMLAGLITMPAMAETETIPQTEPTVTEEITSEELMEEGVWDTIEEAENQPEEEVLEDTSKSQEEQGDFEGFQEELPNDSSKDVLEDSFKEEESNAQADETYLNQNKLQGVFGQLYQGTIQPEKSISYEYNCAQDTKATVVITAKIVGYLEINIDFGATLIQDSASTELVNDTIRYEDIEYVWTKPVTLKKGQNEIVLSHLDWDYDIEYSVRIVEDEKCFTSISIPEKFDLRTYKSSTIPVTSKQPVDGQEYIVWTSSNTGVVTVEQTGKITGVSDGKATVTATLKNGKKYNCQVYVEYLQISATSLTLMKGNSKTLSVENRAQPVTWSSANKKVATVSSKGKVTATGKGTTTITAKVGSHSLTCKVKVEDPKLSKKTATIVVGQNFTLKLSGTSRKITWSTNKKSIANVTGKGVVAGKKKGTAKITAKAGGKSFVCTVKVNDTKLKSTAMKIVVGGSKNIEMKKKYSGVKWSSNKKSVATVNKNGKVTGKKTGTATITAVSGGVKYFCTVTVESAKINKKTVTMKKNAQTTLKITGTKQTVTWKSKNKKIATVDKNGKVTAKAKGTTSITASVGGKNFVCKVTVKPEEPNVTIWISDQTYSNVSLTLLQFKNNGSVPMRIYSAGAKWVDQVYHSYDRNVYLVDYDKALGGDFSRIDYIDVAPGEKVNAVFVVEGDPTWYDKYTKILYSFDYDGQRYTGSSSYYYGHYYSK